MADLSKIDEIIRNRAMNEARAEAAAFMKTLPFWREDISLWSDEVRKEVKIERWRLLDKLQEAIRTEMYREKVEDISKKVLNSIDDLEFLRNNVEALERNQN